MAGLSYARRPAKHIQRRMVVDALRRLRAFSPLSEYEYVGFGGTEFVDFELVHRELWVRRMTSIEVDTNSADRYRFNAPFADIEFAFDRASAVLPDLLDDARLRIVWLDYESRLNLEVLQDLGTTLRKLLPGSVLLVSVNAQGPPRAANRFAEFEADVDPERVPPGTTNGTLARWGWADASHRVLVAEAEAEIQRRSDGALFQQLFHFRYADGARMVTWGGLVLAPANRPAFDDARFSELAHVREAGEPALTIDPPVLTLKEAIHLNAQLPLVAGVLSADGIPEAALDSYADLYRWYPPVPAPM